MRDGQKILQICLQASDARTPLALASVVMLEGSAYRRPGARMLIFPDGTRLGSLSGGCLEADVIAHAKAVCASGKPQFVLYDPKASSGDMLFDMGCKGAVGILIECVAEPDVSAYVKFLADCLEQRRTGVLATVFRVTGDCPVRVGGRLLLLSEGITQTTLRFAPLCEALQADAQTVLDSLQTQNCTYRFPEGTVEVLVEAIVPPPSLLICGAGYDAVPLAEGAARLGWQVTIADHRAAMLTAERFPDKTTRLQIQPEQLLSTFTPDARTVAVVMTHNASQDQEYLRRLLSSPMGYIGLLGPRSRGNRLLAGIEEAGQTLCPAALVRVYSPAGLDIGSETPEEIALAILAEIQAVLADTSGGSLRARQGAIHSAPTAQHSVALSPAEKAREQCLASAL